MIITPDIILLDTNAGVRSPQIIGLIYDSGKIDNIRIWTGETKKKKSDIFMKKY